MRLRTHRGRRSLWGAGMPRSLRQSSPAQKLARLSGRGHCALLRASFPRRLRNSLCEACRAPVPRRPHGEHRVPRGQSGSDAPSAATERPCAARLWESRRRHEQRIRRRVPAPPSDGRERERNLVERARPRSHGPEGARGQRGAHTRALVERARPRSQGPRAREDGRVARTRGQAGGASTRMNGAHFVIVVPAASVPQPPSRTRYVGVHPP